MSRRRERGPGLIEDVPVEHEFSRAQALELGERWLAVFAPDGYGELSKQFLWHVFSGGRTPALERLEARAAYEAQACDAWIMLSNDRKTALRTGARPEFVRLTDALVFPENLAWTMAFTHEEGWLGPYFAKHPDYTRLDAANRARVKKRQEAARAHERGWTTD